MRCFILLNLCRPFLKVFIPDAFPNSKYHLKFTEGEGDSMEGNLVSFNFE